MMNVAMARTVVQCKEPDGSLSFRDHCAPDEAQTAEKQIRGALARPTTTAQELVKMNPVILYAVPECDTCDLVRLQLQSRQIPFTEKDMSKDSSNQAALEAAAGELKVPTVMIGTHVLAGYDRSTLHQRLTEAGYPPASGSPGTAKTIAP